ncbi:MFS transporter [Rhodococcus ruber Chol-4]|uniref:MFS transporter n=1 Tax=Rhodococcus ruber TaxID=1830 RepID=UPI00076B8EEB|nr:MFS transporter [Rhodococcus ruber]KXF85295.1 MFS transporter [Rhodococcus ruber Chol-4]
MLARMRSYRALFTAPGAAAFCLAGFVARLPIAMVGIGIVTMFSQLRGDYGLGGALAAVFAMSYAALTPLVSRAADRHGQFRVLPVAAGIRAAATAAMLAGVRWEAPEVLLFACAIPAGLMPTIGAMVRARWTELLRGTDRLRTAFALEAVIDELCFIVGPVLSVGLSVAAFPEAGALLGAVLLVIGTVALAVQRGTEPPARPVARGAPGVSVLRIPVLLVLVVAMTAMGTIFGVVDVVGVAFTAEQGVPGAATVVLAMFATGSALGGLVFGAVRLRAPLTRQLLGATTAVAVLLWPLLLAGTVPALAVLYLAAGVAVAPTMIVATSLTERIVPPGRLTEGITWTVTGLGVGVAVGSAVVGQVIDRSGPSAGIAVAVVAALVGCACAVGVARLARLG